MIDWKSQVFASSAEARKASVLFDTLHADKPCGSRIAHSTQGNWVVECWSGGLASYANWTMNRGDWKRLSKGHSDASR